MGLAEKAAWFAANTKTGYWWDAEDDLQTRNAQTILMSNDWEDSALEPLADSITWMAQNFAYYANDIQNREQVKLVLDGAGMPADELFTQIDLTVTEFAWMAALTRKRFNIPQSNRPAEQAWARTNTQLNQLFSAVAWPLWDQ